MGKLPALRSRGGAFRCGLPSRSRRILQVDSRDPQLSERATAKGYSIDLRALVVALVEDGESRREAARARYRRGGARGIEGRAIQARGAAPRIHRRDCGYDEDGPASRGARLVASVPHGHWKTLTLVAALRKGAARTVTAPMKMIAKLITTFAPEQCANYFQYAGYT